MHLSLLDHIISFPARYMLTVVWTWVFVLRKRIGCSMYVGYRMC